MQPTPRSRWVHPRCRTLAFWRAAAVVCGLMTVITAQAVARYQVGVSVEAKQSLHSSVFLVDHLRTAIAPGDYLVFRIDRDLETWKAGARFVKRVVGTPGDRVDVRSTQTRVNGQPVAGELDLLNLLNADGAEFERTFTLGRGEYFVVGEQASSFDSRYWGAVHADQIVGRALPLW